MTGGETASGGVTGGGAARGGVTGGEAAKRGVTGGGAARGNVTGGGAASRGVTGGGAASEDVTGGWGDPTAAHLLFAEPVVARADVDDAYHHKAAQVEFECDSSYFCFERHGRLKAVFESGLPHCSFKP